MDKTKLLAFIDRYNLGGHVESVVLSSDGTKLSTNIVSGDKTLAGSVVLNDIGIEKSELGIFDTTRFRSFLKILDDDIKISLNKDGDRLTGLLLSDLNTEVNFVLSDTSVIPKAPKVKEIKEFDVEIPLDGDFSDRFIKAKSALSEVDSFTLLMNKKGDKLEMVIGYASINSNRVKVEVKPTDGKNKLTKPISFNANYMKEILNRNLGVPGAVFRVSEAGISNICFTTDEYTANYYLIKKELES